MVVGLYLRRRKCLAVHFLVLVKRNEINLHDCRRNHVRRFAGADKIIERGNVNRLVADNIRGDELTAVRIIEGLHRSVLNALELTDDRLYLFEFNTESANLDLTVTTADKLDVAIRQISNDIARAVAAKTVVRDEGLGCFLGEIEVSSSDLRTGHP